MSLIEDEEVSQASMDQLLVSNNLTYRLPSSLSVVVKRSGIKNYFDRTAFKGGQNGIVILNGGDQYIDGQNSMLCGEFQMEGTAFTSVKFGSGAGFLSLIERVVLTSESGVEISRFENVNNFHCVDSRYRYSKDWQEAQGSAFGVTPSRRPDGVESKRQDNVELKSTTVATPFCIPMSMISPLFKSNQLLPGMGLMSGLKIEISFTNQTTAFVITGAGSATSKYSINNLYVLADSYMLSDSVLGSLNDQSAQNSLEIVWEETTHVQGGISKDDTMVNQDSKLAVARAQSVWTRLRPQAAIELATADSFACAVDKFKRFQYRLAGLHFPNQYVDREVEMYNMALQNWDHNRNPSKGCSVSLRNFNETADKTYQHDGQHIACTTLERSNVLSLSGLPIGSGRVLTLNGTLGTVAAVSTRIDMFIQYVKLCRVYIDRVVVKS